MVDLSIASVGGGGGGISDGVSTTTPHNPAVRGEKPGSPRDSTSSMIGIGGVGGSGGGAGGSADTARGASVATFVSFFGVRPSHSPTTIPPIAGAGGGVGDESAGVSTEEFAFEEG